jgi:phosphate starvation-inducible protein PhoH
VSTTQTVLTVGDTHLMSALVGPADSYLRRIEDAFVGTDVRVRGNEITVGGAEADRVATIPPDRPVVESIELLPATGVGARVV